MEARRWGCMSMWLEVASSRKDGSTRRWLIGTLHLPRPCSLLRPPWPRHFGPACYHSGPDCWPRLPLTSETYARPHQHLHSRHH